MILYIIVNYKDGVTLDLYLHLKGRIAFYEKVLVRYKCNRIGYKKLT